MRCYGLGRTGLFVFLTLASCWLISGQAVEIEVNGNKRSKERHIQRLVRICSANLDQKKIDRYAEPERRAAEASRQLEKCLLKKEYFESVQITQYDAEKIAVTVKDKWTFVLLPTYVQSEETVDNIAGLLFYETNLGGIGHQIGFVYSQGLENGLNSYFVFYSIPDLDRDGKYELEIILLNRDTRFYSYEQEEWTFRTREIFRFLWLRLDHRLNDKSTIRYGYAPAYLSFSEGEFADGAPFEPTSAANLQTFNLGFSFDDTSYKYYYSEGSRLELTWHQQFLRDDTNPLESGLVLESNFVIPTYNRHSLQIAANAGWRSHIHADDTLRVGNRIGSRGIPADGAWGQTYVNLGLDYQMPLVAGRYGYWTAGPFVDLGYLWNTPHHTRSEIDYAAAGIASYVHLLSVNVPALGLFYSFNNRYQNGFLSFYIGFTL